MHFRWGETFLEIIDFFTTPELRKISSFCRDVIREVESEYDIEDHALHVTFDMFDVDFRLTLELEARQWVLHVLRFPHPPRRRRRKSGAARARPRARPEISKVVRLYASRRDNLRSSHNSPTRRCSRLRLRVSRDGSAHRTKKLHLVSNCQQFCENCLRILHILLRKTWMRPQVCG